MLAHTPLAAPVKLSSSSQQSDTVSASYGFGRRAVTNIRLSIWTASAEARSVL